MCRTLTADTDFHGTRLREGEKMLLLFESANFDEEVFGDPDDFRIDRNPNSHLAFGFGTHFCLGNRLADDSPLPLRPANFVSGPDAMPVLFTPTKPLEATS